MMFAITDKTILYSDLASCLGTDNRDMLPTYYYRDDALDIWKVIQDYVGRLLRYFYKTDQVTLYFFYLHTLCYTLCCNLIHIL